MKKGIDLSLSTVVISALLLIFLVVMIMIFSGRMKVNNDALDQAERGSDCPQSHEGCVSVVKKTICTSGESMIPGNFKQVFEEGKVCCCVKG